jgi:transcriptional regulator with XRE-family HTH domain
MTREMTRGQRMRKLRQEAGLNIVELANLSTVSHVTISRLELDQGSPNLETIILLADALGLSIDEYVGHVVKGVKV